MADKKSESSRPSSAQGALLLMPASDSDSGATASSLLVPYAQSDTSSLFPGTRLFLLLLQIKEMNILICVACWQRPVLHYTEIIMSNEAQ